jgi:hypothetical protein
MKTIQDIQPFAELLEREQTERLRLDGMTALLAVQPDYAQVNIKIGKKYACVDVGANSHRSGRYMVDLETGEIFGIKGYGVIHRGHRFGTLETINEWSWGGYVGRLMEKREAVAA